MKKKQLRIISGLTATGELTIGNYLGAIKNILELQNDESKELILFVADLHGLTIPLKPNVIHDNIISHLKLYLAAGIDVKRVKLFIQSRINGHTDLAWLLMTNTTIGQLSRMTQYKDKSVRQSNKTENLPTGILMYPTLMAADIILYNCDGVIVGKDQQQHLELTRDIVLKINRDYQLDLKVPKTLTPAIGAKIMALKEPTKKMSKSDKNRDNTIFLLDDEKTITKKINNALTDNENKVYYDFENKVGVTNLINIYAAIKGIELETSIKQLTLLDYKELKATLISAILDILLPLQAKYHKITTETIDEALKENELFIQNEANKTLTTIKKAFGLY